MTAIGVLYGYGSQKELVEAGAHQICATPDKLIEHTGIRSIDPRD
jgi:phosphoglycolate phosphatase